MKRAVRTNQRAKRIAIFAGLLAVPQQPALAQLIQVDAGSHGPSISWDQHRFRGVHAFALYSDRSGQDDWLAGAGFKVKSWLLGREQNLYVSTGATLVALNVDREDTTSLAWRNVFRFEPRAWQKIEFAALLDYGPSFSTQGDAEQWWGASMQMDYRLSDQSGLVVGWRRAAIEDDIGAMRDVALGSYVGLGWLF